MAIFEQNYRVNVANVNSNALITNFGMLSILEDIACKHSDTVGLGLKDVPVVHLSWVLLAWKVNIIKRVTYGENLRVRTWARPASKFYTYRDFDVYNEDDELVCIATSKWVLIDALKGSIIPITSDIIDRYLPESKNVFESSEIDKLVSPVSVSSEYVYTTQRRDIDINKHMHNLNYLSVAYEALPEDVYTSSECNNIEIMYKKGIVFGDKVMCCYEYSDNAHYVTMKNLDTNALNAVIKLY